MEFTLLFLTTSRSDFSFSIDVCARFQSCHKESHLTVVKRIIRYVRETVNYGIYYSFDSNVEITDYSDTDWTYLWNILVYGKQRCGMAY